MSEKRRKIHFTWFYADRCIPLENGRTRIVGRARRAGRDTEFGAEYDVEFDVWGLNSLLYEWQAAQNERLKRAIQTHKSHQSDIRIALQLMQSALKNTAEDKS